jgi:hypothetical protein
MVPIIGKSLSKWTSDMRRLLPVFMDGFESRYGYPPDANSIIVAALDESGRGVISELADRGVSPELLEFYSVVREVSLPDLGNGIFIHSPASVASGITESQPTEVHGSLEGRITVFGSDGGGALVALLAENGKVYKLSGGSLIRQDYDVDEQGVEEIADSVWGLLVKIREELGAAITT